MKGTLVAYPDEIFSDICSLSLMKEDTSSNAYVAYRHSMYKYAGGPEVIEIHGVWYPPPSARLNFNFIILLLTLGVPLEVSHNVLFNETFTKNTIQAIKNLLMLYLQEINLILCDRSVALRCIGGELDADGRGFHQDGTST